MSPLIEIEIEEIEEKVSNSKLDGQNFDMPHFLMSDGCMLRSSLV